MPPVGDAHDSPSWSGGVYCRAGAHCPRQGDVMPQVSLRIGAFEPHSRVNGPGVRAVIWVQGCRRHCPGCSNPEFQDPEGGTVTCVADVLAKVEAARPVDGISLSGGVSAGPRTWGVSWQAMVPPAGRGWTRSGLYSAAGQQLGSRAREVNGLTTCHL